MLLVELHLLILRTIFQQVGWWGTFRARGLRSGQAVHVILPILKSSLVPSSAPKLCNQIPPLQYRSLISDIQYPVFTTPQRMVPSGVYTAPSTILNDFHSDRPTAKEAAAEFPQFSRLPVEILLAIWKCTLQRHRLIGITVLDESEDDDEPPLYTARNSLGNTISGERYRLLVTTNHRLTPLFWVNRQARQAALEFYRVHISYDFNAYGERLCLYLNPEFDILHVRPEGAPGILVDFVHDVKAYDPLGLGILNMAIGTGKPRSLSLPMGMNLLTKRYDFLLACKCVKTILSPKESVRC